MTRGSRVRSVILALAFALSTIALTTPVAAAPGATGDNAALAPPTNLRVVGTAFDGWHSWPVLDWDRSADDNSCCMDYYMVNFQAVDPANPFPSAGDPISGPQHDTSQAGYGHCLEGEYEVTVRYLTPGAASAPSNKIRVDLPFWLSG
jgi:hypothetical protein